MLARRRPLAALCAGLAAVAGLHAVRPPAPDTVPVVLAARDLHPGDLLDAEALTVARWPADLAPDGAANDPAGLLGLRSAGALPAGAPLGPAAVSPAGPAAPPGTLAMPLRLPDAGTAALLRPGDVITLVLTDPRTGRTALTTDAARVLTLPAAAADAAEPGRVVVLALPSAEATALAGLSTSTVISYAWTSSR